jgi:vitamin B12 transporter
MIEAAPFGNLILSAGARRDEFSNFEGATTSRVAGVWTIYRNETRGDAARLRASWGEGFRAPTLFELNFDQFGVLPNPDLRPERARGFDVGVDYQLNGSRPGGGRLRATYFHQRVKDQIDFDFAGNGYFNIDRVNSDGVEVEASWTAASFLTTRVVYTYVDARDAITGAQILRTPKHSGSASLSLIPVDPLLLSATISFNGREADFPAPNDSFVRLDLRAAYALSDLVTVYGRIENATDKAYQDVSGYGEPGLSAFAGVRINL